MKKVVYSTLAAAMMLALCGCGGSENGGGNSDSVTGSESAVVSESGGSVSDDAAVPATEEEPVAADADIASMEYEEAKAYLEGLPETNAADFEYTTQEMNEGECAVTGYNGSDSVVIIPQEIDGLTVVEIGTYAFASEENIVALRLPQTVKVIESYGLFNMENLLYVTGLDNVEYLGLGCLMNNLKAKVYEFGDSVKEIEEEAIFSGDGLILRVKNGSYMAEYFSECYKDDIGEKSFGVILEIYD